MLLGITGCAGVGKDTVAEYLWRTHAFTRIAFADPMKKAAQTIFGLTDEETWKRELKEVVIPYWGLSPRRMFQMVGTDAMQSTFGREVWTKRWRLSYDMLNGCGPVVVPDVRFNQEAEMIRSLGGCIVQVLRKQDNGLDDDAKAHVSEAGIDARFIDRAIHNNGTFDELFAEVEEFIKWKG